ncbi:MAG: RNA dependent RNA polymerase, partial [Clostridium sp.]
MEKQFRIHSVDTKAFYSEEENKLNLKRFKIKEQIDLIESWALYSINEDREIKYNDYKSINEEYKEIKKTKDKAPDKEVRYKELRKIFEPKKVRVKKDKNNYKTAQELELERSLLENKIKKNDKEKIKEFLCGNEDYELLKDEYSDINKQLTLLMAKTNNRVLNPKALNEYSQITLFDNSLSRTMEIEEDELNLDIIVVRAYHYKVLEQLITNGFDYIDIDGVVCKYRVFTASAGQIRTKKVIFIKEEKWNKYEKSLMCGLTIDKINKSKEKGCNINKFLAYLALCNSATDEIEGFDIDRCIVVEDYETMVNGDVSYIDNVTFEVTDRNMDIPMPHSDGCGWINPKVCNKNFMIRLPWVKGLMTPVDYIKFCDKFNNSIYKIKDIYGKEYDLKVDNIDYVFTKSQFKMWK